MTKINILIILPMNKIKRRWTKYWFTNPVWMASLQFMYCIYINPSILLLKVEFLFYYNYDGCFQHRHVESWITGWNKLWTPISSEAWSLVTLGYLIMKLTNSWEWCKLLRASISVAQNTVCTYWYVNTQ